MLDDPAEVLGACLKKLGYSINSGDPGDSGRALRDGSEVGAGAQTLMPRRRVVRAR